MNDASTNKSGLVISAEVAAYAVLIAMAAAMRLPNLGWMPLDQLEAALALPAYEAAKAQALSSQLGPPLLFHLQRLVFWLFGSGDGLARLVPALAGAALVAAAYGLRPLLGKSGALMAAALFTFSPLWVFFGRQVSAASLSSVFVVLALSGLISGDRRGARLAVVAFPLALASGGVTFSAILAGLACLAVAALQRRTRSLSQALADLWPESADRRQAALTALVVLLVAATGLLTQLDGTSALLQAAGSWAGRFGQLGPGPWDGFLFPLLVYAPLTLAFGLAGAFMAARERGGWGLFILVWVIEGLLIGCWVGSPTAVAEALLPLTLAAAIVLGRWLEDMQASASWSEDGVFVAMIGVVLGVALINALTVANAVDVVNDAGRIPLLRVPVSMAIAFVILGFALWVGGWPLFWRVSGTSTVVALAALAWANGSWLNYRTTLLLREPMRQTFVTPDGARLAVDLSTASWWTTKDPHELKTLVDPVLRPALAWQVRSQRNLEWAAIGQTVNAGAVVLPHPETTTAGATNRFGPAAYRGQTYRISGAWQPRFGDVQGFLQWYLQRRAGSGVAPGLLLPVFGTADLYVRVSEPGSLPLAP